jgi:hypothetical protein
MLKDTAAVLHAMTVECDYEDTLLLLESMLVQLRRIQQYKGLTRHTCKLGGAALELHT